MGKPRKRGISTSALILSALVGIVMPLGDTSLATAQTLSAPDAETRATVEQPGASEPGATTPHGTEPDASTGAQPGTDTDAGTDADSSTDTGAPTPPAAPLDDTGTAPQARPFALAPGAEAAPPAAPATPHLTWSIVGDDGVPVPGAKATLQGPAAQSGGWGVTWRTTYSVTDCVGSCGPESMDQDPRPGHFLVDRLVSGRTVTQLSSAARNQRFRVQPSEVPTGQAWNSAQWHEIPANQSWYKTYLPETNPWSGQAYAFGELQLSRAGLVCAPGNVYGLSETGQLQHIVANDRTGTVEEVGTSPTPEGKMNGLGIGAGGQAAFAFERSGGSKNVVYRYDVQTEQWSATSALISTTNSIVNDGWLVAGAVDVNGRYWVGGYSSDGTGFQLWAMNQSGTKMERHAKVVLAEKPLNPNFPANQVSNGDFAFDNDGNLFLVRGVGGSINVYGVTAQALADAMKPSGSKSVAATRISQTAETGLEATNGIAYDSSGKLYLGATSKLAFLTLPVASVNTRPTPVTLTGGFSSTDLATCGFPPTVELRKELPDGRAVASDQFRLQVSSNGVELGSATTTGNKAGAQPDRVEPIPVGVGTTITIAEKPGNDKTKLANYSTRWECKLGDTVLESAKATSATFTVPETAAGTGIVCTITNSLMQVSKTSSPASGTTVNGGDRVDYTLTFNNTAGATAVAVNYRDYLSDVLDDATFITNDGKHSETPVITASSGLTTSWDATGRWLTLGGTVAAGASATVEYSVQVKPNSVDAATREASTSLDGYFLRNKLARGTSETPPKECVPGMCTEHPIHAWTVTKDSLPVSTARLHKGGNVHYRVAATKLNAETRLSGLVLTDDLTQVLKTAGWAPDAAVPGGAQRIGVYLYDATGRTIGLDGRPNTDDPSVPQRLDREVAPPQLVNTAPAGEPADDRWIVTSGAPIDLPAEAVAADMWFAVQAGESPAGIPDPAIWATPEQTPKTGWKFVNYATGIASAGAKPFAPNSCITGVDVPNTALAADAAEVVDTRFPEVCRTQHELSKNYFTIRKDAGGAGVQHIANDDWDPDPTGLWNMVGHEFEVRDHDTKTHQPTSYPSVKLCRTDYDPYRESNPWRGQWVTPEAASNPDTWAFGAEGARIQRNIERWNDEHPPEHPGDTPLPVCATIYPIADGPQQGRWRSENLEAGDYWLVETKAPTAQAAVNAQSRAPRPVAGVQLLAQPVPFKIWPEEDGPADGQAMHGRGQLDVGDGSGGYVDRCDPGKQQENGSFLPGGTVAERKPACVNPSGYLMLVKDPVPAPLPLTGGQWLPVLTASGIAVVLAAVAGAVWWRRRQQYPAVQSPRHGA